MRLKKSYFKVKCVSFLLLLLTLDVDQTNLECSLTPADHCMIERDEVGFLRLRNLCYQLQRSTSLFFKKNLFSLYSCGHQSFYIAH